MFVLEQSKKDDTYESLKGEIEKRKNLNIKNFVLLKKLILMVMKKLYYLMKVFLNLIMK